MFFTFSVKKPAINTRIKQAILDFMKGKEFVRARDIAEESTSNRRAP